LPPPRRPLGSAGTQPLAVGPAPALRWSDQLLCEVPFSGDRNGQCTRHMLGRPNRGAGPAPHIHPGPSPESTIAVTVENSVCSKQPELAACSSMECHSIDWMRQGSCAGLGAHPRQRGAVPRRTLRRVPPASGSGWSRVRPAVVAAPNASKGTVQGARDRNARGEILRPLRDQQRRRRSARTRSLIKSESLGIEEDQTPS
jgi:hypothetical protein